ncbi:MAG: ABC transporter substrate-binding protein [Spirochaetia bacterium]
MKKTRVLVMMMLLALGAVSLAMATPESETEVGGAALRIASQPIVQIDPALISSDAEVLVANNVYDYLVDVTPGNTVEGRLATGWSVSSDGKTYVFDLADGVTFHDGSGFSADDVVWTFDRLRDPALEYPTSSLYSNIQSISATGNLEVTFTLENPNPFFLFDLSDNHALILKAGTTDADTDFNGTGPFAVVEYSPEDRIILEANDSYFLSGLPRLSGLEIIFFNEATARVDALRAGQVDLAMNLSTDLFSSLKGVPGINAIQVATNAFDLVRLRSDRSPGDDPRVTRALRLATDREAIFDLVLQGNGFIGRDSPIGPLYTTFFSDAAPLPSRDIAAARSLLAEAGYGDGLDLELHTPDTGNRPQLAAVLKEQWADAGVNVEIIVEPESVYYGDNQWTEAEVGITGWGSRPYPQFYLDVMLKTGAKWNESHYSDAEFDRLATISGTTLDEAERIAAYRDIQALLIERGPVIIPYFFAQFAAINDDFSGFELKAFPGRTDLRPVGR